ncbi:hypothetical protein [Streptomyces iconiensis]|uniref:Uncharacterized protein n=1 Tax=Streptomyces iconiensis TaxID=1384038 RepID=A0ABT7A7C6_9ACTN|nr:hypothetical protein [Streptomyces iconiensis]MDJ1137230.1 hypothetical protein [Streptomyces iconiensis]
MIINAYVPGLPHLADALGRPPPAAQPVVMTCLVGLAVGQLAAGPMSGASGSADGRAGSAPTMTTTAKV